MQFTTVRFAKAYDENEVDVYFQQAENFLNSGNFDEFPIGETLVRHKQFALVKSGYKAKEVDRALNGIELKIAQKTKKDLVEENGIQTWVNVISAHINEFKPVLNKPKKEKFEAAADKTRGYKKSKVDKYCSKLNRHFFDGKGRIAASDIAKVRFNRARGKRAYDVAAVDRFLDQCIDASNALEC